MLRENMMKQPGYTSKIIDFVMHKHFDRKQNRVTKVLFDITYEETRPDGSVYQYILKDVESPFKECCNISYEMENQDLFLFDRQIYVDSCYPKAKLELKDDETTICSDYIIKCIKEPDPIEVTMEEIEAKFGKKVKIVREK